MNNNKVPFLDLIAPHQELEAELLSVFQNALKTAGFIGGPMVEKFERDFAQFCGTAYCVGVNSGTDALRFALYAAGVRPGDVVLTVPNTFIATTEAISQTGATFEFVDVDEQTCNLDPARLRDYLERQCDIDPVTGRPISRRSGRQVTAIVPVHLYGQMADMDPIMELAETYNLIVIEDACQAHGAEYFSRRENRWRRAGTIGKAAAFSFYPGKNLGACGEAGAVTTDNAELARIVSMLRDHGQAKKYYHDLEGYNGRLDAIQAGILSVKLSRLASWTEQRRKLAALYDQLLTPAAGKLNLVSRPSWSQPVYHLYVVRSKAREALREHLAEAGIGTGIHYPIALHLQKAYSESGYRQGDFPVAEKLCAEVLSLPLYPELTSEQQQRVALQVLEFVGQPAAALAAHA